MKKRKFLNKSQLLTIGFFVLIGIIIFLSLFKPEINTEEEVARCIGEKTTLYVQLGCPHCDDQEALFGENIKHIEVIDCFYERESCIGITATPTWVIKGEQHTGKKTIKELKELTGC